MKTIGVEVQGDFLRSLARVSPVRAVEELVWNSLDADADRVAVVVTRNAIGGITEIRIEDDGHGIAYDEAEQVFSSLGGSKKRTQVATRGRLRPLHGREGRGRFRAFRLGDRVTWNTCFCDPDGQHLEYVVEGVVAEKGAFTIGDPVVTDRLPGTTVTIRAVVPDLPGLTGQTALAELAPRLSPYLLRHPTVRVVHDGEAVDPVAAQVARVTYEVEHSDEHGTVNASLEVIEWRMPVDRRIFLCSEAGIVAHSMPSMIHAPGFEFTAYLRAPAVALAAGELAELDPVVVALVEVTRSKLRDHFKERIAERGTELIAEWQSEGVYPYKGAPATPLERVERDTFDVVAVRIDQRLRTFQGSDTAGRRFQLRLLREALTESPGALRRILDEVLQLTAAERDEFAGLLGRASLGAIVRAGRLVADRIDLLNGLEALVYDRDLKASVKERGQLHEIVGDESWIFGEEFHLSHKEAGLSTLLRDCLGDRSGEVVVDEAPPPRRRERVDVVVTRSIPSGSKGQRRNLVIELKRPSRKIDSEATAQVLKYARLVADDPRYPKDTTQWDFLAISSEADQAIEWSRRQPDRPRGLLLESPDRRTRVWALTWSEVLEEARGRLEFYREQLELSATRDDALAYLRRIHETRLPKRAVSGGRK